MIFVLFGCRIGHKGVLGAARVFLQLLGEAIAVKKPGCGMFRGEQLGLWLLCFLRKD